MFAREHVVLDVFLELAPLFEVEHDGHLAPVGVGYELNAIDSHVASCLPVCLEPYDLRAALPAQVAGEGVARVHD